ncbi:uncharacterized protein J4E87_010915 [Alternaria ethzedia]|uniref:uncharacterized protein n=1 Tax=Alternaria ethzedia TaxID=181014 RepID=UPI0020C49822|nr:uncharacterized protein J4E87_010915 [Alternaria ethzedia]KAI4610079.1 hypothetical protein J4E87_010915 [Alternaria ethzedia]
MTVPNIGDILVLSQKAWKIGRTFSACQKNAPVELQYVETEIGSLAKSLASLAETLHAESVRQLLQDADQEIKYGVGTILRSCQRTVDDLDSLIDQYQVIKKHRTVGGFAIERSWSDLRTVFDIDQENITSSKDTGNSRGSLVEYSHRINQDDPRDVEMIQASEECRIAVVRKRITDPETKAVRVVTSVWAFSDDNTTRVELRMEDDQMYIPYSSYFNPAKASITVLCELIFHDVKHGNRPVRVEKTSWVNYVFDSPQAAALFQNELMGRTLLATFRTEKTMRIHEGLSKSFSYAEQMCGLENLRVWEDNDTGAIIALIHFSADFRNGYLAFYLNSSVNPIRVKDGGDREVKIKGLRVPIDRGDRAMRKDSFAEAATASVTGKGKEKVGAGKSVDKGKVISGAKIEFATEMEKREFLDMCSEMQRELIELPDLLGVN